jgi:tryptophanyl-tRNA synthetase
VGDIEVKEKLYKAMSEFLKSIRERYQEYEKDMPKVEEILKSGTEKTREIVKQTLQETKEKMSFL